MSNRLFTTVPVPQFPSNTFSLSRSVMFAPRMQKLYCPNVIEILPGDGINEITEQFARTQPMVAPTFAKINADQHAFFVPFWQINEHFDDFITGGEKGDYQDKLPYCQMKDIYDFIVYYLSYGLGTSIASEDIYDLLVNEEISVYQYNIILEQIQSVIEHIDLLRAIPIVLPDFLLVSEDLSEAANIIVSNYEAFVSLNESLSASTLRVNYAPFISYLKVWCEYFRDENLCVDYFDKIVKHNDLGVSLFYETGYVAVTSILDYSSFTYDYTEFLEYLSLLSALFGVLPRAWKKDYFTAALPFTQKGPEVLLPIAGTFPVDFNTKQPNVFLNEEVSASNKGTTTGVGFGAGNQEIFGSVTLESGILGSTINDLRRAEKLEEFYEADARGGNRYPENTLMQWGVKTPDSRLPRAIFLGSNSSPVQISEVVQNSSTNEVSPQGNLAGKGISYGNNRLSRYFYTMHGFLLNFYSLRVNAVYEQGVHPMFSRFDRTEYAWPRFAHLGEQPVYTKELFVDSTVKEDEVFGYEPRYSEYKSEKSSIHHSLKGSLNFWTMSRRFANKPVLNEEFIYGSPRLDNFAVTNKLIAPFLVEIDYRVRANRKLPFFGVPML